MNCIPNKKIFDPNFDSIEFSEKICNLTRCEMAQYFANFLMKKYKSVYKCASIKDNIWYEFKNHRWVKIDSAYSLRNLISSGITEPLCNKRQSNNEAKNISKVILNLNNSIFKNNIIRKCCELAYDPYFFKNMDENNHLICFENGIYDLKENIFRDGCPDDNISISIGYNYSTYDKNSPTTKYIKNFFKKLQHDKEMRRYILILLSSCLDGLISDNIYIFSGINITYEDKLTELLKYTFGNLCKSMDIGTMEIMVSNMLNPWRLPVATPDLFEARKARIYLFDSDDRFNDRIVNIQFIQETKENENIPIRDLYQNPIYFKPQFKSFLFCDKPPNTKYHHHDNIIIIPFPKIDKISKEKNFSSSQDLFEWKEMFMSLLIKTYQKYKRYGLIHPKIVLNATKIYKENKCR